MIEIGQRLRKEITEKMTWGPSPKKREAANSVNVLEADKIASAICHHCCQVTAARKEFGSLSQLKGILETKQAGFRE